MKNWKLPLYIFVSIRVYFVVASLKKAVSWGTLNAKLIFLLVVRGGDMKYMNSFFDLTSKLVWDKKKVKKLVDIGKFDEFISELL